MSNDKAFLRTVCNLTLYDTQKNTEFKGGRSPYFRITLTFLKLRFCDLGYGAAFRNITIPLVTHAD